jgi:hypothetical protein
MLWATLITAMLWALLINDAAHLIGMAMQEEAEDTEGYMYWHEAVEEEEEEEEGDGDGDGADAPEHASDMGRPRQRAGVRKRPGL